MLYNRKGFNKLVGEVASFIDNLEKLFPVKSACYKLVKLEIEEVDNELSLVALKEVVASRTNKVLLEAVI